MVGHEESFPTDYVNTSNHAQTPSDFGYFAMDGSNDKIKPIVPGIHTFSFFRVYNRWGNLVFESTDPDAAWDGSYKGEMQPQDSYSYVIEGYNFRNELIRKQGTITLVR